MNRFQHSISHTCRSRAIEFLENVTNHRTELKFPSEEDLNGAAVALMRLQDTYKLDTSSIARGELNGVQYSTEMNSNDCFEMGRQSYLNKDYYHTLLWMNEAMARLADDKNQTTPTPRADILEYLAFSIYKQGESGWMLNCKWNSTIEIDAMRDQRSAIKSSVFSDFKRLLPRTNPIMVDSEVN